MKQYCGAYGRLGLSTAPRKPYVIAGDTEAELKETVDMNGSWLGSAKARAMLSHHC